MAIKNELQIEYLPTEQLKDYDRQLRKPSKNQKPTFEKIAKTGYTWSETQGATLCL